MHLGPVTHQLEKRSIRTERGDINREVVATNSEIRQPRARINELKDWLKTEIANAPKALADIIEAALQNRPQSYDDKSKLFGFLRQNNVQDYEHLQQVIDKIYTGWFDVSDKMKAIEKRIGVLNENIKQGGNIKAHHGIKTKYNELHSQYTTLQKTSGFGTKRKAQKALDAAGDYHFKNITELTLYDAAVKYFKGDTNGKITLPFGAWREEVAKLEAENKPLTQKYYRLKDEIKQAEEFRMKVFNLLHAERLEREPRRTQDRELSL